MLLSVVVASYNSALTVRQTLSSILSSSFPSDQYEVIVVDDGSTDDTVGIIRDFPIRLFACEHRGHGPARNLGIREAKGDIICFTDSDIIVPDDWLKKISTYFTKNPGVSVICGPLIPPIHGHVNKIQQLTGETYFEAQNFPTRPTRIETLAWTTRLTSANSAYRREALASVGGFPEFKTIKANDMYLMWSLLEKGKCVMFLPDLKVVHFWFPWALGGVFKQQFLWGRDRSMLTAAFNSMHSVHLENSLKNWILYTPLGLVRSFIKLPLNPNTKQFLSCFQIMSFVIGRLYGLGCEFRFAESK